MILEWCKDEKISQTRNFPHKIAFMIIIDLIECTFVDNTNAPFLRCFPFSSKLKANNDNLTTEKYLKYQTYGSEHCLKFLFESYFHLFDISGEHPFLITFSITQLDLICREASNIHF